MSADFMFLLVFVVFSYIFLLKPTKHEKTQIFRKIQEVYHTHNANSLHANPRQSMAKTRPSMAHPRPWIFEMSSDFMFLFFSFWIFIGFPIKTKKCEKTQIFRRAPQLFQRKRKIFTRHIHANPWPMHGHPLPLHYQKLRIFLTRHSTANYTAVHCHDTAFTHTKTPKTQDHLITTKHFETKTSISKNKYGNYMTSPSWHHPAPWVELPLYK